MKCTVTFRREIADDDSPADLSYLEDTVANYEGCTPAETELYVSQDKERIAAYHRGDWHMIGVRAVATVWISREGYKTNYELESAGCWGIESDSGDEYIESGYQGEVAQLRADIEAIASAEFKS